MIEGRKFRIGDRLKARSADGPVNALILTDEDMDNLKAFSEKLGEAIRLLETEMDALRDGRLDEVPTLAADKNAIVSWLEMKMPLVEPFVGHEEAADLDLATKLSNLKKLTEENGTLVSQAAGTVSAIRREYEKVANRHSLAGLYGKSGKHVGEDASKRSQFSREL